MTADAYRKRSPVAALVLGWILPGAGHAYAGLWGKAILFFLLITALVVAAKRATFNISIINTKIKFKAS